jgi:hypothetical protein
MEVMPSLEKYGRRRVVVIQSQVHVYLDWKIAEYSKQNMTVGCSQANRISCFTEHLQVVQMRPHSRIFASGKVGQTT